MINKEIIKKNTKGNKMIIIIIINNKKIIKNKNETIKNIYINKIIINK